MGSLLSLNADDGCQADVDVDILDLDLDNPADVEAIISALKEAKADVLKQQDDADEEEERDIGDLLAGQPDVPPFPPKE